MQTTTSSERSQAKSKLREPFIPAWWRENLLAELSGMELKVYLAYLSHKNADGLAWPSLQSLSKTTGLNICTVKIAKRGIVKRGLSIPGKQDHAGGRFGKKVFQVCTVGGNSTLSTVGGNTDVGETTQEGIPTLKVPQSFEVDPSGGVGAQRPTIVQKGVTSGDAVRRPVDAERHAAASQSEKHVGGGCTPSTPLKSKSPDRNKKSFSPSTRKAKLASRLAAKARSGGNMFDGALNDNQRRAFSYIRYDRDDLSNLTDGFVWTVEDVYLEHKDQLPPPGIFCCKVIDKLKSEQESCKKLGADHSDYYWPPDFQDHRDRLRAEERGSE